MFAEFTINPWGFTGIFAVLLGATLIVFLMSPLHRMWEWFSSQVVQVLGQRSDRCWTGSASRSTYRRRMREESSRISDSRSKQLAVSNASGAQSVSHL